MYILGCIKTATKDLFYKMATVDTEHAKYVNSKLHKREHKVNEFIRTYIANSFKKTFTDSPFV